MSLDQLNKELLSLQNDYNQHQNNTINFQEINNTIKTDQIKRANKSGDHRIEFNDRLTNLKMQSIYPQEAPNFMIMNNNLSSRDYNHSIVNEFESQHPFKQQQAIYDYQQNYQQQIQKNNPNMNKFHEFGYYKTSSKSIDKDYRENINTKIDNFIFDNSGYNIPPLIKHDINNNFVDHRVQLQDSSRSLYRDQANERMSMYSPLSRSANVPISLFSSNINQTQSNTTKEELNNRMSNYQPLSCTIPINSNKDKDSFVKSLMHLDQQLKQIKKN